MLEALTPKVTIRSCGCSSASTHCFRPDCPRGLPQPTFEGPTDRCKCIEWRDGQPCCLIRRICLPAMPPAAPRPRLLPPTVDDLADSYGPFQRR